MDEGLRNRPTRADWRGRIGGGHKEVLAPNGMDDLETLPEALNARESDVIKLVAQGLSNREIGARLGLTEGSVKWYLQCIFAKLGVRRRSVALIKARKFGLV